MATKRGPKVEPKEINKYKVVVNDLPEKPQAVVFEEAPVVEEKLMTEEEIVAQEEYIEEIPELEETQEEPVNVKFEFQDKYHFGPGNGDAVIDTLPQPQKRKKAIADLNQSELRLYHKTGFLPEI